MTLNYYYEQTDSLSSEPVRLQYTDVFSREEFDRIKLYWATPRGIFEETKKITRQVSKYLLEFNIYDNPEYRSSRPAPDKPGGGLD